MDFPNRPSDGSRRPNLLRAVTSSIRAQGPVAQFIGLGLVGACALAALGGAVTGDGFSHALVLAISAYGLALGVALVGLRRTYPHAAIGSCNAVTVVRLMLTCVLLAALLAPASAPWAAFVVAVTAFALDGADGWLARKEGYASGFGARFDVEVDAALALILACYAYFHVGVGFYVILLGLPRYLFVIAQFALPWLNAPLPERFSRKVVCVVQIAVLIAILLPVVGSTLAGIAAGGAALALLWSFAVDIRWLWSARP